MVPLTRQRVSDTRSLVGLAHSFLRLLGYLSLFILPSVYSSTGQRGHLRIHFVPHTHDDAGWLKNVDQYYVGSRQEIQNAGVEYILDTVVSCLGDDATRMFTYAEIAFFEKWWSRQGPQIQEKVRKLVASGQLSFVNGGWVQHDEAATHFRDMIDQTTRGHNFLLREFNVTPSVAWQIDPFGHSSTQASLLTAKAGFSGVFFARSDYDDMARRKDSRSLEGVWRASANIYGKTADTFVGNFPNHYNAPQGFNFEWGSNDPPIQDDPTLEDYNLPERVEKLLEAAQAYADTSQGNDVMVLMGTDFTYSNALTWFKNIDKLIAGINGSGKATAMYSSPEKYLTSKVAYKDTTWPLITDDFFPYADHAHTYWTGYFTSRPTLKHYIRKASALLATFRKMSAVLTMHGDCGVAESDIMHAIDELDATVSLCQHHDAITGTAKQHVTNDYAMRLTRASQAAYATISDLLRTSIFAPHECTGSNETVPYSIPEGSGTEDISQEKKELSGSEYLRGSEYSREESSEDSHTQSTIENERKDSSATHGDDAFALMDVPDFVHCEYHNVSVCAETVEASRTCQEIAVVLFNGNSWETTQKVRVPIANAHCGYAVMHGATKAAIPSVTIPVSGATVCMQMLLATLDISTRAESADFEVYFQVSVPPLGYTTVLLSPPEPNTFGTFETLRSMEKVVTRAMRARHAYGSPSTTVVPLPKGSWEASCDLCTAAHAFTHKSWEEQKPPEPVHSTEIGFYMKQQTLGKSFYIQDEPEISRDVVLENDLLKVLFDGMTGRITAMQHKGTGQWLEVSLDLIYWESLAQVPYGGAYIMRPGAQVPIAWPSGDTSASLEIVKMGLFGEARIAFAGWGTMVVRLWPHAHALEIEWMAGPIPIEDGIGKEVALRVQSNIMSGDAWWTDSNGMQMIHRRRAWRRSWPLNNTEPVAGNFYPFTSTATIRGVVASATNTSRHPLLDSMHANDEKILGEHALKEGVEMELSLVTDRAQAVTSLQPGSMHVLLHRRLLLDDGRGVGEALNETMCGCSNCHCPGLVASGTFQMLLEPSSREASARLRTMQALAAEPPLVMFSRPKGESAVSGGVSDSVQKDQKGKDAHIDVSTRTESSEASSQNVRECSNVGNYSIEAWDLDDLIGKNLLFFEAQKSGHLPEDHRVKWRGDSYVHDHFGKKLMDLKGGWFDGGDHLKLSFPLGWTLATMAWAILDGQEMLRSGMYDNKSNWRWALDTLEYGLDYMLRLHVGAGEFVAQVGEAHVEHESYYRAENDTYTPRTIFHTFFHDEVFDDRPGGDLLFQASAAMSAAALALKSAQNPDGDHNPVERKALIAALESEGRQLFEEGLQQPTMYSVNIPECAKTYPSNNWQQYAFWAAAWLFRISGSEEDQLVVEELKKQAAGKEYWADFSWSSVYMGAATIMLLETNQARYQRKLAYFVHSHMTATNGIAHTPEGLTFVSDWGSLRHANGAAALMATYSRWLRGSENGGENRIDMCMSNCQDLLYEDCVPLIVCDDCYDCNACDARVEKCKQDSEKQCQTECNPDEVYKFAERQVTYTLGAAGHSYVVGYGCNPPLNPYHRDSTLTYEDMSETKFQRKETFENRKQNANLLIGAVLGGPNYRDDWVDDRMDVPHSSIALDYNAALFLAAIQVHASRPSLFQKSTPKTLPMHDLSAHSALDAVNATQHGHMKESSSSDTVHETITISDISNLSTTIGSFEVHGFGESMERSGGGLELPQKLLEQSVISASSSQKLLDGASMHASDALRNGLFSKLPEYSWRPQWFAVETSSAECSRSAKKPKVPTSSYVTAAPLPPDISLLTFTTWHGRLMHGASDAGVHIDSSQCQGVNSHLANATCDDAGAEFESDSDEVARYFLVRLLNIADPSDALQPLLAEVMQGEEEGSRESSSSKGAAHQVGEEGTHGAQNMTANQIHMSDPQWTVDMCKIIQWPQGSQISVVETTLTANRVLKDFERSGGVLKFESEDTPICFKSDPADCTSEYSSAALWTMDDERVSEVRGDDVLEALSEASVQEASEERDTVGGEVGDIRYKSENVAELRNDQICGDSQEHINISSVQCGENAVNVCVQPMHVRTFIVTVH